MIGELGRVEYFADLTDPLFPRVGAPEVIDPQESPLEEVLAQARRLHVTDAHGADVRRHDHRALKQRRVGQPHDPRVWIAVCVPADGDLGQLRRPDHQVDSGIGIVGEPADAPRLAPHLRVHQLADREAAIGKILGRELRREASLAERALSRFTLRVGGGNQRECAHHHDERDARTRTAHRRHTGAV